MNMTTELVPRVLVLLTALGLVACGEGPAQMTGDPDGVARIEGSVTYRERMMLPPDVAIEVQLEDISRADAPATVLATVPVVPEGGPPYDFVIDYDPAQIDKRMWYALRATISRGDRLMFTTTEYIDPFQGNPIEILVHRVPEPVRKDGPGLESGPWVLQTLSGEPAPPGAGDKPVDIQFDADEQRAAGFSGCNRYTGGYAREGISEHGSPLKFGPLAGTMMACVDGGELERSYLQVLAKVTAFRLEGDTLSLLSGPEVVATFKAS